jgi:TrmH family RNA methyltransferase
VPTSQTPDPWAGSSAPATPGADVAGAIRIVLIEPSHPGNIGAAARAMKNMDLHRLVLVKPRIFPHPEATMRASGADDVLAQASVVGSVAEAIADCTLVLATTSRDRDHFYRVLDAHEAAARVVAVAQTASPVAVLFGAERTGLTNEALNAAHALLRIPTIGAYASLNLAMAVQIVAYEIARARGAAVAEPTREQPLATAAQLSQLYDHLAAVMEQVDFRDRTQHGTSLMNRIRRFLQRAELDANEVNILRGILTAVQQQRRRAGQKTARPEIP